MYTSSMTWQAIRELYPEQWLLLEVLEAESKDEVRHLKNLAVLEKYADSMTALRAYRALKKTQANRELLVLHTHRMESTILQRHYVGVRGAI
jgi:hypothetical protein